MLSNSQSSPLFKKESLNIIYGETIKFAANTPIRKVKEHTSDNRIVKISFFSKNDYDGYSQSA